VGQVAEAAFKGDFHHGFVSLSQQEHRLTEALVKDLGHNGLPGLGFENAAEVVFLKAGEFLQFMQMHRFGEISIEMAAQLRNSLGRISFFPRVGKSVLRNSKNAAVRSSSIPTATLPVAPHGSATPASTGRAPRTTGERGHGEDAGTLSGYALYRPLR
jgi:hypothetical protein